LADVEVQLHPRAQAVSAGLVADPHKNGAITAVPARKLRLYALQEVPARNPFNVFGFFKHPKQNKMTAIVHPLKYEIPILGPNRFPQRKAHVEQKNPTDLLNVRTAMTSAWLSRTKDPSRGTLVAPRHLVPVPSVSSFGVGSASVRSTLQVTKLISSPCKEKYHLSNRRTFITRSDYSRQ
jgi:hypothetical protein